MYHRSGFHAQGLLRFSLRVMFSCVYFQKLTKLLKLLQECAYKDCIKYLHFLFSGIEQPEDNSNGGFNFEFTFSA